MKKVKGALAIEATISFTVFLIFLFILMSIVKLSLVYITINDITSETTKKIAGSAYPISYINDYIDETVEKVENNINNSNDITGIQPTQFDSNKSLKDLATDNGKTSIIEYLLSEFKNGNLSDIEGLLKKGYDELLDKAFEIKGDVIQQIMANIYIGMVKDANEYYGYNFINEDNIKLVYFKVPVSDAEKDVAKNLAPDIKFGNDFNLKDNIDKDDVVLVVKYDYSILVPFFPKQDITLTSVAMERAWVKGYDHIANSKTEAISLPISTDYYRVGNGKKYHKDENCRIVKRYMKSNPSKIKKLTSKEIESQGLKPCKFCYKQ